jgi:GMP synthase-like glutamine amidotransferase
VALTPTTALVIENDPTDDIRRLGHWLTRAGLDLVTLRPYAGDPLPDNLDDHRALVVLGGEQHAYPGTGGEPGAAWFGACESLLRKAVRHRVPTLAICLGAQLLAAAHGGIVAAAAAGPELGAKLVARRDAADTDLLFARVPFTPDVIQWHHDEITELPAGAVLLAASTHYPHQAFRLGPAAWGLQFHIEPDAEMVARWAGSNPDLLDRLGRDPAELVSEAEAVMDDMAEVWQPFAARFAAVATGELTTRPDLPVVGR